MIPAHSLSQRRFCCQPKTAAGTASDQIATPATAHAATIHRRFHRKYTAKIAGVTLTAIARPTSRPATASVQRRSSCARYRPAINGSRATKFV